MKNFSQKILSHPRITILVLFLVVLVILIIVGELSSNRNGLFGDNIIFL